VQGGRVNGYRTIKRGRMAGDAFTQIRNAVFRDVRLSAKAMGVFGHLSTHRDGYGVTPERISRCMRDGVSAIKSALQELEACGYLYRERERRPDGTLGSVTYYITDQPEAAGEAPVPGGAQPWPPPGEKPRSEPEVDNPPVDYPSVENRPPKNTKRKNTNQQKTKPVPPAVPQARATTTAAKGRTDGDRSQHLQERPTHPAQMEKVRPTPGVELLLQIAADNPQYLLTGPTLRDQGVAVSALLAAGWTAQQVQQAVTGRCLPEKITTSVGAIVARRLGEALSSPVPQPMDAPAADSRPGSREPTWTPPPITQVLAAVPPQVECEDNDGLCGRPAEPGYDQCAGCMGWSAPGSTFSLRMVSTGSHAPPMRRHTQRTARGGFLHAMNGPLGRVTGPDPGGLA
jgi:hypothetical protein